VKPPVETKVESCKECTVSGVPCGSSRGNAGGVPQGMYSRVSRGISHDTWGEIMLEVETHVNSAETNCPAVNPSSNRASCQPHGNDNMQSFPVPLYLPHNEVNSEGRCISCK